MPARSRATARALELVLDAIQPAELAVPGPARREP